MEKIIVTGCAGFIGMSLCKELLEENYVVAGIDDLNDYYDIALKNDRLKILDLFENFEFYKCDISNLKTLQDVFQKFKPSKVVNLAAQAGVRYSLKDPHIYIKSNVTGFMNILECCRIFEVEGLIYASSSSVYGESTPPFKETNNVDSPISIYAATKISNELMAKSYSHLYGLHTTGLRFFTVYGPWGRPDMGIFIFTEKIKTGQVLSLFNKGDLKRDFTFIDDIVCGIKVSILKNFYCEVFNLGNSKTENLMDIISLIEEELNKKAKINLMDMQLGDVKETMADIQKSKKMLNFNPQISIKEGIPLFIEWYTKYID